MGVFKCKETGTWYVMTRYRDWKGERKQKCKRGFATKRAAQDWEQKFHMQNAADMDMTFEAFYIWNFCSQSCAARLVAKPRLHFCLRSPFQSR